jgi:glucosamine-6-phosphate deaminase
MNLHVHAAPGDAANAAAAWLTKLLAAGAVRTLMLAAGNTPLELYRLMRDRAFPRDGLTLFVLDEYLEVPATAARNCTNLLRGAAAEAWGVAPTRFYGLTSDGPDPAAEIAEHERRIAALGGLDCVILGLGQNGHLGFNEPGSDPEGGGRVVPLEPISIEANRVWFHGQYAPARGVTTGLKTVLAARHIALLAFGAHKAAPVARMMSAPPARDCPASWLQGHSGVEVFLDQAAAARLPASPDCRG